MKLFKVEPRKGVGKPAYVEAISEERALRTLGTTRERATATRIASSDLPEGAEVIGAAGVEVPASGRVGTEYRQGEPGGPLKYAMPATWERVKWRPRQCIAGHACSVAVGTWCVRIRSAWVCEAHAGARYGFRRPQRDLADAEQGEGTDRASGGRLAPLVGVPAAVDGDAARALAGTAGVRQKSAPATRGAS